MLCSYSAITHIIAYNITSKQKSMSQYSLSEHKSTVRGAGAGFTNAEYNPRLKSLTSAVSSMAESQQGYGAHNCFTKLNLFL